MYIKIYNKSQLILLEQINPLLGKYVRRLEEKDFEITETQIDEVIKKKIGDNILKIIRQYVFDDELLIYFAWGMDNITAKDFVVCTNKQILMLDREMLGATKNESSVKQCTGI